MARRLPLWLVTGVVEAPVDAAWPALLGVAPEVAGMDVAALAALDAPRTFAVPLGQPPVSMTHVAVDPVRREVSQQGGWWYRGAVAVTPHPDGSEVARSITNVASPATGWLVRFVHRHDEARISRGARGAASRGGKPAGVQVDSVPAVIA